MWKRSWLSREVLLFGCFSQISFLYAGLLWFGIPGSRVAGALTVLAGVAGVTASACIYLVRPRPAWNSKHTVAEFYLTGALLGLLLAATMQLGSRRWLPMLIVSIASVQLLNLALKFLWFASSDSFELKATARLLSTQLRFLLMSRSALLVLGGIVLPLFSSSVSAAGVVFCSELIGRYLFFVSVVPKNMAASYLTAGKAAA
jgi:DMSO reductase anchor subunit